MLASPDLQASPDVGASGSSTGAGGRSGVGTAGVVSLALCSTILAACGAPTTVGLAGPATTTPPQCIDSQLAMTVPAIDRHDGNLRMTIVIRNSSEVTCVIAGNPGVSMVGPQGQDLGAADQSPLPDPPDPVALARSRSATAYLFARGTPASRLSASCVHVTQLSVSQPDGEDSVPVDLTGALGRAGGTDVCGIPRVGPLAATARHPGPISWPCPDGTVSVHPGAVVGHASHRGMVVLLQNDSGDRCTISGYAGVSALDTQGQSALTAGQTLEGHLGGMRNSGLRKVNDNTYSVPPPPTVLLRARQRASFLVEGSSPGARPCTAYSTLAVVPPTGSVGPETTTVGIRGGICGPLEVHPILSGTRGTG